MRKFIAIVLVLTLTLSASIPAFAEDASAATAMQVTEKQIQVEIQNEEDRIFESVYEQLEEQNALSLWDTYVEVLTPEIEANVRSQYGSLNSISQATKDKTYTLTYGGAIGYKNQLGGATVANLYLDYDNSYYYVLSEGSSSIESIVSSILGLSLNWGPAFTALFTIKSIYSASAKKSIRDADGYAQIMNVQKGIETGSVVIGWKKHPKAIVPSDATDVKVKTFKKHNPFKD